jgi:hypothetical protein
MTAQRSDEGSTRRRLRRGTVALASLAIASFTWSTAAEAATAAPAAGAASLTVSSTFPKVSGDTLVLYKYATDNYDIAKVSGSVSGLTGSPLLELEGTWFPFTSPAKVLTSETLKLSGGKASFSFDRTPSSATKYFVTVLASSAPGAPTVATSNTEEVYVSVGTTYNPTKAPACARPTCTMKFTLTTYFPPADASQEEAKYLYSYLGLNLNSKEEPPPPTEIKRYAFNVHKSVNPTTGLVTDVVSFSFSIGNDGYNFAWTMCTVDTLTKDGLGLPTPHNCGDPTIPYPIPNSGYLG